jgi:ubiquinone/menaquinone biosynthesis C-methylase UbiE
MERSERGQVTQSAAEVYEEFFVPALFQQWASLVADVAQISSGQRVLDVACGTGILTREVANRVGANGSVVGLDPNEGMLVVAKRKTPEIEWRQGYAEVLPFESSSFDAVVCQFGLMFFENRRAALEEMMRVLRQGGHLAVAVWDSLENIAGYAAVTELLERLFGSEVADKMGEPFVLGNTKVLQSLFTDAGVSNAQIMTYEGIARFPSINLWVYTEIKGWTLADMIDDVQYQRLLQEAEKELRQFVTPEGTVAFRLPAHIVTATKVSCG